MYAHRFCYAHNKYTLGMYTILLFDQTPFSEFILVQVKYY